MDKNFIEKMRNAYVEFSFNRTYMLEDNLLKYFVSRVVENESQIKKIIEIKKLQITYEELLDAIKSEIKKQEVYMKSKKSTLYDNNFIAASLIDSKGLVAIECYDTIEVIKYLIRAIKSRNAVVISDVKYDEYDLKSFICMILKTALKKFNIDDNIISIYPFEEVDYADFDAVVFTYDNEGKSYEANRGWGNLISNKCFIYLEDESFKSVVDAEMADLKSRNVDVQLLTGDFKDVLEILNKSINKGASIYTKNSDLAYNFVNLVKVQNVFVNTSLTNIKNNYKEEDLYFIKNIVIPLPHIKGNNKKSEAGSIEEQNVSEASTEPVQNEEKAKDEELSLVARKDGILQKIKDVLSKLFR